MIFYIPINDDQLGGSIWLRHIGDTLTQMGHETRYCHFESDTHYGDFTIIQSEWIEKVAYKTAKRAIVLLGHFTSRVYPDPYQIRPKDFIATQWKGPVVEKFEKESGLNTFYWPHGYFPTDYPESSEWADIYDGVWLGLENPYRDLSRFEGLNIKSKTGIDPRDVFTFYKSAKICPNIHLNIQKGQLVNVPESILDVPGYQVNERLFWIPGAGGFQIADENPLVRDFYDEDEVPMATAEDFKEIFNYYLEHPDKRREMAKKAQERTLKEHTYKHRLTNLLKQL